jgi:exonuclease III
MEFLKIKSVNCRGLNTDEKRLKVYTWLNDSEDDIIFLQETHYIKEAMWLILG